MKRGGLCEKGSEPLGGLMWPLAEVDFQWRLRGELEMRPEFPAEQQECPP